MKRLAAIVCGTTLAVAALSGCGSDDGGSDGGDDSASGGDYCGLIEEAQDKFGEFEDASIDDLNDVGDQVDAIAGAAPDDIKPEWEKYASLMDDMTGTLEDAGIATDEPLEKAAADAAKKDPEKAQEAMTAITEQVQGLQSSQQTIQDQVKQECDIDLGADSPE